jgi:hypothetical protein
VKCGDQLFVDLHAAVVDVAEDGRLLRQVLKNNAGVSAMNLEISLPQNVKKALRPVL